jgi:hypothetical protein
MDFSNSKVPFAFGTKFIGPNLGNRFLKKEIFLDDS